MNTSIIGALPPPAGVTPNFVNPYSILPRILGMDIFLMVLLTMTTLIYAYTRYFINRESFWNLDFAIIAYISYVIYSALCTKITEFGAGKHQWNVPLTDIAGFEYWAFVGEVFYNVCMACVRLALSLQLKRIFTVGRDRRYWAIMTFIVLNMVYYITLVVLLLVQCVPFASVGHPERATHCFSSQTQDLITATSAFNLVGDVLMLAFPLYCVWGLRLSAKQRLSISGLFLIGLLVVVASSLRFAFTILDYNNPDLTFALSQVGECTFGELSASILVVDLMWFPGFFKAIGVRSQSLTDPSWTRTNRHPKPNYHQEESADVELCHHRALDSDSVRVDLPKS